MVGGGSGRKLSRLSGAVGKLLYATMNTASVVSFRLSGSGTNTVTSPQIPTNPGGQVGVGWRPSWHAAVAAAASTSRQMRLGMGPIFGTRGRTVNLTPLFARNNVESAMPIYEYRCTKCRKRVTQQEGSEAHGRRPPACPKRKAAGVQPAS